METQTGMQEWVTQNSLQKSISSVTDANKKLYSRISVDFSDTYVEIVFGIRSKSKHMHLPSCFTVVCGELASEGSLLRTTCCDSHRRRFGLAHRHSLSIFSALARGHDLLFLRLGWSISTNRGGWSLQILCLHLCVKEKYECCGFLSLWTFKRGELRRILGSEDFRLRPTLTDFNGCLVTSISESCPRHSYSAWHPPENWGGSAAILLTQFRYQVTWIKI